MALADEGIAAYQAGDIANARRILAQAVKEDRDNEQAWYYLSKTQTDPVKQRQCLEMVLRLNPANAAASAELAALDASGTVGDIPIGGADGASSRGNGASTDAPPRAKRATPTMTTGFAVPNVIPGSPDKVSGQYFADFVQGFAQDSLQILTGKSNPAIGDASWWRVSLIVLSVGLITGLSVWLAILLQELFGQVFGVNVLNFLLLPLVVMIRLAGSVAAGTLASYWYTRLNLPDTRVTILDHVYTQVSIWAPASLFIAVLTILAGILRSGALSLSGFVATGGLYLTGEATILTIMAAVIFGYTLYLMAKAIRALYPALTGSRAWVSAGIMLVITALIYGQGIFGF